MYPRISTGSAGAGVLQVPMTGSAANAYYPTVGMQSSAESPSQSGFGNGPTTASGGSPTSQNFPLLRVHVAEQYRTLPPVMVSPGLDNIQHASFRFDFDYERKVVAEYERGSSAAQNSRSASQGGASTVQVEDPWTSEILKFTEMGFSREEVCMALAALGSSADKDNEFMDFCKHYRELRCMGFPSATCAGALMAHPNDFEAATEACLAVQ